MQASPLKWDEVRDLEDILKRFKSSFDYSHALLSVHSYSISAARCS